jgi:hypothetical protein
VALNEELLNELVASWLAATGEHDGSPSGASDLRPLVPFLKQASIRAETGRVLVDFQISI